MITGDVWETPLGLVLTEGKILYFHIIAGESLERPRRPTQVGDQMNLGICILSLAIPSVFLDVRWAARSQAIIFFLGWETILGDGWNASSPMAWSYIREKENYRIIFPWNDLKNDIKRG